MRETFKAIALGASMALAGTAAPSPVQAQNNSALHKVVETYTDYLKRTYRTPAGIDLINQGYLGNPGQKAFSAIAEGIRDGRLDRQPDEVRLEVIGCHLSDLGGMAGQVAAQLHPNTASPSLPTYKWPFFAKIRDDATRAYYDLQNVGHSYDCGRTRSKALKLVQ